MKKTILFLSSILLLAGCYPDYVMDYDEGAGVYTAYQYDLRTFVLGENESFDFTVALGGVISNTKDRAVKVVIDNSLLTSDLSLIAPTDSMESFTALDGMLGTAKIGNVSQSYVKEQVTAAGITALTELPESYYTVSGLDGLTIKSGRHTAAATVKATEFVKEDEKMFAPYYALGFRILSAEDSDIDPKMGYEVIAVKCENMLFGEWAYSGETSVQDAYGTELYNYTNEYSVADDKVYTLTTKSANSLLTNKIEASAGKMLLTLNEDNTIKVECADGSRVIEEIPGEPSVFNGAKKLEEREISLNYKYTILGNVYVVRGKLNFRSRTRDGVLEYQGINE